MRWLLVVSFATLGCVADAGHSEPPRIELGTGVTAFEEISDGDGLELVFGIQGGWHLDVAARLWNLDPDETTLEYSLLVEGGVAPLYFPARYPLSARKVLYEGDSLIRLGDRLVLDIEHEDAVLGLEVTVEVRAMKGAAVLAGDARLVRIVADPS